MFVTSLPGLRARLCWLCKLPSKSGALFFFSFFCYPNWTCQLAFKSMHKNAANKETNCIFIWRLLPAVTAQNKSTHMNQTEYHANSWPTASVLQLSLFSQRYPEVAHHVVNTWSGCIMWLQFSMLSLTCVWPTYWVSWLSHRGYQTSVHCLKPDSFSWEDIGWPQRVSPSGGWLSGWVWSDSCPGDGRTERWSWRKDQWYLGNLSPSAWHLGRGAALFSKWN